MGYPQFRANSCFVDSVLVLLFFSEHSYLDFTFLAKIGLKPVTKCFVFGKDKEADFVYRKLYKKCLKKCIYAFREIDSSLNATDMVHNLLLHHHQSTLTKNKLGDQQDAIE